MNIMNESQEKGNEFDGSIEKFFNRFKMGAILRKTGATKLKGITTYVLVMFLLKLVFKQKNFYTIITSERDSLPFEKDAVYRFLGDSSVRWEELVPSLSAAVIPIIDDLTSKERRCALVIDDSPYYCDRSKKVELLSR